MKNFISVSRFWVKKEGIDFPATGQKKNKTAGNGLRRCLIKISGGIFFILCWYALSLFDKTALILPSPVKVLDVFLSLIQTGEFWSATAHSLFRCFAAFGVSAFAAFIAGIWWGISGFWRDFFSFFMAVIKSTPVITLILLSVFWFGAGFVPVFAGILMSFPVITEALISAFGKFPQDIEEMCRVFRLDGFTKVLKVYVPYSVLPFLNSANTALGIIWKVVVAGEVISIPGRGLGVMLVDSKNQIDIAGVFSSAFAVIVFCWISGGVFSFLVKRIKTEKYIFTGS